MQELILTLEPTCSVLLGELRNLGVIDVRLFSQLGNVALLTVRDGYDLTVFENLPGVLSVERPEDRPGRFVRLVHA